MTDYCFHYGDFFVLSAPLPLIQLLSYEFVHDGEL